MASRKCATDDSVQLPCCNTECGDTWLDCEFVVAVVVKEGNVVAPAHVLEENDLENSGRVMMETDKVAKQREVCRGNTTLRQVVTLYV